MIVESNILLGKLSKGFKIDQKNYIIVLEKILSLLEKTKLIKASTPYMGNYRKGDREIYHRIFKPDIIPNFTFTRLVAELPYDAEIVDQYKISIKDYDESLITILKIKNEAKLMYHVTPPENTLSEEHNMLLNLAKEVLIEHQLRAEEFTDTERTTQVLYNI